MWFCPECGKPTCPCGSHDSELIQRVTGYLADYSGMNEGKQREIKDRTHYNIDGRIVSVLSSGVYEEKKRSQTTDM